MAQKNNTPLRRSRRKSVTPTRLGHGDGWDEGATSKWTAAENGVADGTATGDDRDRETPSVVKSKPSSEKSDPVVEAATDCCSFGGLLPWPVAFFLKHSGILLLVVLTLLLTPWGQQLWATGLMVLRRDWVLIPSMAGGVVSPFMLEMLGNMEKAHFFGLAFTEGLQGRDPRMAQDLMFFYASGGYDGPAVGTLEQGIAEYSWQRVSEDAMDPHQQRRYSFASVEVGTKDKPNGETGNAIPYECFPAWQLMISSDDPRHTRVRTILFKAMHGLNVGDTTSSWAKGAHVATGTGHAPRGPDQLETGVLHPSDWTPEYSVMEVVGMNLWRAIIDPTLVKWNEELAAEFRAFDAAVPACSIGLPGFTGPKNREAAKASWEAIRKRMFDTAMGKKVRHMMANPDKEKGEPVLETAVDDVETMFAFGIAFAGMGGTKHLTQSTYKRIMSDTDGSKGYRKMWDADPLGFMREQARMDPPVVSYTALAKEDVEEEILGTKVLIKKGTTREMCISVANRDEAVFGKDANVFNPKRQNLDKVLNWNGIDGDIVNAPRGCPGHDLSQKLVKFIVEFYLQGEP